MFKKILILIIGFNALAFGLSIFQSCGLLEHDASVCNIWFTNVYQHKDSNSEDYGKIEFELYGNDNCQSVFHQINIDLIKSCYAITKCVNWQNSIIKESIEIIFDKKIIIENDTIVAGENIISNEKIKDATDLIIKNDCNVKLIMINISEDIGKKIEFESGIHLITFRCSTSDKKNFETVYWYEFKK